ncbi:hypothetical protein RHSIM_Rhsim10G0146100 [Rhododendron simsii]|uniref:Uncharacterized protein n=1 Tax=Rhododendron simsii TaxID=118357 RepID=A0A834LC37_RHOSS|nr:hypothetical protein RHSIM_Rhsim10G0146100 [Rhododendron simsii]
MVFNHSAGNTVCSAASNFISKPNAENSPGLMDANRMAVLKSAMKGHFSFVPLIQSVSPRQLWEHVCGFAANAGTTSNDHCNYSDHTLVQVVIRSCTTISCTNLILFHAWN